MVKQLLKFIKTLSKKNERVIIIDDLIATGGTAKAAAKLVEKSGGKIECFVFVINLFDLGGKDLLEKESYKILSLIFSCLRAYSHELANPVLVG